MNKWLNVSLKAGSQRLVKVEVVSLVAGGRKVGFIGHIMIVTTTSSELSISLLQLNRSAGAVGTMTKKDAEENSLVPNISKSN